MGERLDGRAPGEGGEGMRPFCSGRGLQGQGSAPGCLPSSSAGGGSGTRIGVCSPPYFLFLSAYPTSPQGPPGRPSNSASLSRCLFSSKESACHLRVPSSLTATQGPVWPHVSPSTSALSLVLSHGDWRKVSQGAPFWASPNVPQDPVGEGRGTGTALGPLHLQR